MPVLPTFRPLVIQAKIREWKKYARVVEGPHVLRFANVDEERMLPFSKGRGTCSCCGGVLIAKCGKIVTHHWAHDSKDDCDSWSEPIGPWHLWWQGLVRDDSVEIARGPHRADIVGNGGVVVELQHSSISPEDIAAREAFYGDMVWLFDATERFAYTDQGSRAFFSLGKTKHLELCKKPVFLDFGFDVLQVEQFTDAVTMVSGFGIARSREWFAHAFLSDVRQPGSQADEPFKPGTRGVDPWSGKGPIWKMKQVTQWFDAAGKVTTVPKWSAYIEVAMGWKTAGKETVWDFDDVIARHPEIANGWTKDALQQMRTFLGGKTIILGGLLRLLPSSVETRQVSMSQTAVQYQLDLADGHIRAGRLPVITPEEKAALMEGAKRYEASRGWSSKPPAVVKPAKLEQPSLFDVD